MSDTNTTPTGSHRNRWLIAAVVVGALVVILLTVNIAQRVLADQEYDRFRENLIETMPGATEEADPPDEAPESDTELDGTDDSEMPNPESEGNGFDMGTRSQPLAHGEVASFETWDVSITETSVDESGEPLDPYFEDSAPPDGDVVPTATIDLTFTGDKNASADPVMDLRITYVGPSGSTYEDQSWLMTDRPAWSMGGEMYGGATESGEVVAFVPDGDVNGGVWAVEYYDEFLMTDLTAYFVGTASPV